MKRSLGVAAGTRFLTGVGGILFLLWLLTRPPKEDK